VQIDPAETTPQQAAARDALAYKALMASPESRRALREILNHIARPFSDAGATRSECALAHQAQLAIAVFIEGRCGSLDPEGWADFQSEHTREWLWAEQAARKPAEKKEEVSPL
jgi:hypothetical protein